ncbi:penicillin-binding protein 1B [Paraglaciecola aquimarina]|uniref:Penicillin-binding protein 1B n=1 Tax=Paraglaciecola aquimarina TaxID=1235557 RepID=A0ABU3SSB7_9ALTE|nr:penicillin-binding protein 1B [Paraglaciecola aquimarina]MDU0352903.1 penicillin-binding protein 1B [Paraglaciecola aquimarina]
MSKPAANKSRVSSAKSGKNKAVKESMWRRLNPFRWLCRHWLKLSFIFALVLGSYCVYLDAQISQKFAGNKWQVPAQIFARPMHLAVKQEITIQEIEEELKLLGYRRVIRADSSGEYQVLGKRIRIQRRKFDFAHGSEPLRNIEISINSQRISEILELDTRQSINDIYLEPWLVTRLQSSEREDRMLVNMADVPPLLTQALVAVEDNDFYQHYGIAPLSIMRALIANISAGRTVQGGSTLTQQLVKNLFLTREQSITRKAKEALMALIIELRYSKETILQAYLNEVFLGQNGNTGVYGFGLASYFYFARPLNELSIDEMAMLVGIIKGPSYYNPKRHPERVTTRRNLVLRMMFEAHQLTANEYEVLVKKPIKLAIGKSLQKDKHPAFMDMVRRELKQVVDNPDILASGVKVFTTLDSNAQFKAERAVSEGVVKQENRIGKTGFEAAMIVTDIDSGEVRSIVGGREANYAGFNRALDAKRAIGSLIKPAIYLTALEQAADYNLATLLMDEPIKLKSTQGKLWQPQNSDKKFRGQVPLLTALSKSLNVPTVTLGMNLGLGTIADTIWRLGVEEEIQLYPAMTLGAVNFSPLQVNQMYQTIANNGRYIPLHSITDIVSPDNTLLWSFEFIPEQRVDEKATYLLNYALHKVTLEGTAKSIKAKFPNVNMAGKTGTTDDYRDSWFSGFDKNMLITSWIGKDNNQPVNLSGASGAMQLFIGYQQQQEPKSLVRRFPSGLAISHFDNRTGQLSKAGCKDTYSVPAITDALPAVPKKCFGESRIPEKPKKWWQKIFD